ncbi:MAG TPA: hypothetical protein VF194_14505 [Ferrovibrio sp.]|uniref:hypothetical protein n=1 Tax=Ferrovibrio sp. TaxID=1917215 RepID=UPI002ED1A781
MRRANAPDSRISRRHLILGIAGLAMAARPALAAEEQKKKKKKSSSEEMPEKPPVNSPILMVEAVTAPVAGNPPGTVIMTLNIDCGTVENARAIDALMPRVYNAVIFELNREPWGRDGRIYDRDLELIKQRLLFQINRALQGPKIEGVYIRSLQEVPRH